MSNLIKLKQVKDGTKIYNELYTETTGLVDKVAALESAIGEDGSVSEQIEAAVAAAKNEVYQVTSEETDISKITLPEGANPKGGDVLIVTNALGVKSAYSYDNEDQWVACDGNVDATKVILKDNITLAGSYTQVGNLTKTQNGTATFETAGKSVAAALTEIFSKRLQPNAATQPAVTTNFDQTYNSSSKKYEDTAYEVGTKITPSYKASLSTGSYTYGPATGITATSWSVTAKNGSADVKDAEGNVKTLTTATGSFDEITIDENTSYTITAVAQHGAGATPVDNLGTTATSISAIAAGSKSATSKKVTGFRSVFYGYKAGGSTLDVTALTSAQIRALGNNPTTTKPTSMTTNKMQQIFFAFPATMNSAKPVVKDATNGAPQTVSDKVTVMVEGAGGFTAVAYDVYYVSNASAASGELTFNITY